MSQRLDEVVAALSGVTRSQARSLIMEGRVKIDGEPASKAGQNVRVDAKVEITEPRRFVSRGGEKLEGALEAFSFDNRLARARYRRVDGRIHRSCAEPRTWSRLTLVRPARLALAQRSACDRRRAHEFSAHSKRRAGRAQTIVIDTSFISLRTILARAIDGWLRAGYHRVIKPQFEAGERWAAVAVRDPSVHRGVLRVRAGARSLAEPRRPGRVAVRTGRQREFLGDFLGGESVDDERMMGRPANGAAMKLALIES